MLILILFKDEITPFIRCKIIVLNLYKTSLKNETIN